VYCVRSGSKIHLEVLVIAAGIFGYSIGIELSLSLSKRWLVFENHTVVGGLVEDLCVGSPEHLE